MKGMNMDTLTPKHSSSSSGCSTASSTTDIKTPKKLPRDAKSANSRSRSFLYCISKHLGRHFLHNHRRHRDTVYNSQEDVRSSSTDSFSLSFERTSVHKAGSGSGSGSGGGSLRITSSSIDLTAGDEHTSRTSSVSPCSRFSAALCPLDNEAINDYQHIYVDALYRPNSVLDRNGELSTSEEEEDDDDADGDGAHDGDDEDNDADSDDYTQHLNATKHNLDIPRSAAAPDCATPRSTSSVGSKSGGGLHLSRISISSSVSRMLHHLSAGASTRSLSCSSTPLRCFKDRSLRLKASMISGKANGAKKSITSSKSAPATSMSTSTLASNTGAGSKKKDKKQQSILRPPIHYVYMKGMSGLYSRVPRYTVCCPYAMQQFA